MYLVSRTATFAKLFFIVSFTGLFMYIALAFYSFHSAYTTVSEVVKYHDRLKMYQNFDQVLNRRDKDLKYILLWTSTDNEENPVGEGQSPFIDSNCSNINCFLTTNKTILNGDYSNFDAVIFNISILGGWNKNSLPRLRSPKQKYVFHGMVASEDQPICNIHLDNYFNWTWSYKLYSDIFTPFLEVRDYTGKVVAPDPDVIWKMGSKLKEKYVGIPNVMRITKDFVTQSNIDEVNTKTKALAWVVKKCQTRTNRMQFVKQLQFAMKQHSLVFDIYGCGNMECPENNCMKEIERHYYFYLAYEDSISEDYVTDKVLMAYHHDAVPIVVGGADYKLFLPENSYVDSKNYTPAELAAFVYYIIKNPSIYREYFKWRKYYTIKTANTHKGLCEMCGLLNDKKVNTIGSYESFRKWWYNGPLREKCYPKGAERINDVVSYVKDAKGKRFGN